MLFAFWSVRMRVKGEFQGCWLFSCHFHVVVSSCLWSVGVESFTSIKSEGSFLFAPTFVFWKMMCFPTPSDCEHFVFVYVFCVFLNITPCHLQYSPLGHSLRSWTSDNKWGIGDRVIVLFLMICLVSAPGSQLHSQCGTSHRMCWKLKKSFPISTLLRHRSATTLSGCPALPKNAQPMHWKGLSLS